MTKQEYPSLDDIDAILITGSRHNSYDNDPWILKLVDFTRVVLDQRRVRAIGVCFGHQIIGRALGVKVNKSDKGWEASVTALDLTKRGQEIFGTTALVSSSCYVTALVLMCEQALHQMHRDIVYEYPEGVENLAYTDKCSVQAMYVTKRFITVQGHPEFTGEIVREILTTRYEAGIFDLPTYEEMIRRVDKCQDGVVVAQAFLKLLLEE